MPIVVVKRYIRTEEFVQALLSYRRLVIQNFHSRIGDAVSTESLKQRVIELYRSCTYEQRLGFHFLALRKVSLPILPNQEGIFPGDSRIRLNASLSELAHELLNELEPSASLTEQAS